MRGRQWKGFAMAAVAAMALSACGGADDAADDTTGDTPQPQAEQPAAEQPAAEQPATEQPAAEPAAGQMAADLPEGVTQAQFNQGQQIFTGAGGCIACHGPEATGTQLAPDLTDDQWINISGRNYGEIVQLIQTGVPEPVEHPGPMPPLGGASLSEQQVRAVGAYVYGISGG